MMALPDLRVATPRSVEDAIATRLAHPGSRLLAGGTDLLVNMRRGLSRSELLIDLSGIDALRGIENDGGKTRIGAAVTIAELGASPSIRRQYRAVAQAAEAIAAPGHRALGTVGGNLCLDTRCIYYNQSEWWRRANSYCLKHGGDTCHVAPQGKRCHAAFTGDLAPALLVLGAEIEVAGALDRRRIALSGLYAEDGRAHLRLADGEIVVAVYLPTSAPHSAYEKVRLRGAVDYPLAGIAAALALDEGAVQTLHVALTGTNSRPFALNGTEKFKGRPVDDVLLSDVERMVQKQVQPMRTTALPANYRRLAAAAVARRLIERLAAEASGAAARR